MHFIRHITNFLGAYHGGSAINEPVCELTSLNGPVCELTFADAERLGAVVRESDSLEALAFVIGRCESFVFNVPLRQQLTEMIQLNRQAIFQYVLHRVNFDANRFDSRDWKLTALLKTALHSHNLHMADLLLRQNFEIRWREPNNVFWNMRECRKEPYQPYSLQQHFDFIDGHQAQAAELAPTTWDVAWASDVEETVVLFMLAQHCHRQFNAYWFTRDGLGISQCLDDDSMVEVVSSLLANGMPRIDLLIGFQESYNRQKFQKTLQLLKDWIEEEIKDPGCI